MSCRGGKSPSVLLPSFLYKPSAFRLLQSQPEQSSLVLGTTRGLLCQRSVVAGHMSPVLPQVMQLTRHYYTAPWHGSIQRHLFHNIFKVIGQPMAVARTALLSQPYKMVSWYGYVLACTQRRHLFRNIIMRNSRPPTLPQATLLPWRYCTATRQFKDMESIRRLLFRGITPGIFLPRRYFNAPCQQRLILGPIREFFTHINRAACRPWKYYGAPSRSVMHFAHNYFGCLWKVMVAAAFINIMLSFVHYTYLVPIPYTSRTHFFNLETVPYTNRTHFVVRSPLDDREYGEACLSFVKEKHSSKILSPLHPDSVRVNLIKEKLVCAIQRVLEIKSCDGGLVHAFCKEPNLDDRRAIRNKQCRSHSEITHLDGLDWEVIVVKKDQHVGAMAWPNGKILVFTGLLKHLETDAEIATALAHEIAHVVARHMSELIVYKKWFPFPLKVYFLRRIEIEADHIGMLLMAAAGFDPHIAPMVIEKQGNDMYHPPGRKRAQFLSRAKIMDEALELYREVMLG